MSSCPRGTDVDTEGGTEVQPHVLDHVTMCVLGHVMLFSVGPSVCGHSSAAFPLQDLIDRPHCPGFPRCGQSEEVVLNQGRSLSEALPAIG